MNRNKLFLLPILAGYFLLTVAQPCYAKICQPNATCPLSSRYEIEIPAKKDQAYECEVTLRKNPLEADFDAVPVEPSHTLTESNLHQHAHLTKHTALVFEPFSEAGFIKIHTHQTRYKTSSMLMRFADLS